MGGDRGRGAKESPEIMEDSMTGVWPPVISQKRRPASRDNFVPAGTIRNHRPRAEELIGSSGLGGSQLTHHNRSCTLTWPGFKSCCTTNLCDFRASCSTSVGLFSCL